MGGSSPHCPGAGKAGKDEIAARTAFAGAASRLDFSSRGGYASKRAAQTGARNGNVSQLVLNTRSQKASRRECGECFGKALAYRILVTAVLLWLVFQTTLLLQGVVKHSEIDLAIRMTWNERLQHMSQSLINTSVVLKQREEGSIRVEQKKKSWPTFRSPKLALVCPYVEIGPDSVFLVTLARGLQLLGYQLELYAMKDGSLHAIWDKLKVPVNILEPETGLVDWSMFDGVVAVSLYSRFAFASLVLEPFRSIPLVWIIQDNKSVKSLEDTIGQTRTSWKRAFERAKLVIFPNDILWNTCARYDTGNFHIIPGSPLEVWEAEEYMNFNSRGSVRTRYALDASDYTIAVASSSTNGIWKAHALIMHAARLANADAHDQVKMLMLGHGPLGNYSVALKAMATQFGLPNTSIHYVADEHLNEAVWAADVVVYVSVSEEKFFPPVLVRAMAFGQLVLAPASQIIQRYIIDGVNGFLYPKEDYEALWNLLQTLRQARPLKRVASAAKLSARNLLASEAISEYAEVLQSTLDFPSEVSLPDMTRLPKLTWEWNLLESKSPAEELQLDGLYGLKERFNKSPDGSSESDNSDYENTLETETVQEKVLQLVDDVERVEEEELEERKEQVQATFEDVNRGVKRAEREKFEFHERDDGELERTGQALCIYEPYLGPGAWPFLHQNYPLYRGLSLSPKGRRPRADDVDAAVRLSLLNDTYYRDNLCEFGAFLAIANRIDRVHKNSWIGFQPWSAAARKVALTQKAEVSLVDAVKSGAHGDAMYFWKETDGDPEDFWSACDAKNAGACRRIFQETFKAMYGIRDAVIDLPFMPPGAWAGMHCWAMSTASFMEFVMFARMFLDALDARLYVEHHDYGKCSLAATKLEGQHCYCRLLEVVVNVWAYHSARRLIYVDPLTGLMVERYPLESRRGRMKVKWFSFSVLKGMDEDMAERADDEHPSHRWLWPHTGEVFWQGILERERQERYNLKIERKRRNKERLARMRSRYKQKSLGRYVKPAPGAGYVEEEVVNATATAIS